MMMPTEFSSRLNARPIGAAGELDHFAGHDARQAVDLGDAVADFEHAADFADVDLRRVVLNFLLNDRSDFVALNFIVLVGQCFPG